MHGLKLETELAHHQSDLTLLTNRTVRDSEQSITPKYWGVLLSRLTTMSSAACRRADWRPFFQLEVLVDMVLALVPA
eukprot:3780927-Amphidinium_carterae.1